MQSKWLNTLMLAALVLGMLPVLSLSPMAATAVAEAPATQAPDELPPLPESSASKPKSSTPEPVAVEDVLVQPRPAAPGDVLYEEKDAMGFGTYIIQLEAEPLTSYRGDLPELEATSPVVTGADKLNIESQPSRRYLDFLAKERQTVLNRIHEKVGRTTDVLYTYDVAYNGIVMQLTSEEAEAVAQLPGVSRVVRNFKRYLQTDVTPEFLDAWGIWDGTNTGGLGGTHGEGIVVGIIDSGINMDHPSFADIGDDGYDHGNPLGPGNYEGWCDPAHPSYDPALVCNDKLIGVYSYPDSGLDPEDDNDHGSHTASTAAGNVLYDVDYSGYTFDQISGMAPHANVIAYDVCLADGGCPITAILAGIDDAVADGVDVINFSIGGGPTSPWDDPDSQAFLAARDAGVFVATSAGNAGPDSGTIGSPGNAPWLTTVGNTTISRVLANTLDVTGPGAVPAELQGIAAVRGPEGPDITTNIEADIVYAGDVDADNITGCDPFPADVFLNSIALIQRGGCSFSDKVNNAANAGATAAVIFNHSGGPPIFMGALAGTTIPSVFITLEDGEAVRDWIQAETDPTARINAALDRVLNPDWADILAAGSSRGPNVNADVLKPDIAAPGTNIFAAYAGDADAFGMMSGTSMASPHAAGAGALMRALHPGWSAAEIQSALMMTSQDGVVKEDATTPANPFDVGAGRLDLTSAALAGLVLDETTGDFENADPALDGDPTTLNLASLANGQCLRECSWQRTFRNTTSEEVTWEIAMSGDVPLAADPMTFTVAADATQVVEFTADVSAEEDDVWLFGEITLTADDPDLPEQHLPVAVLPTSGVLPDLVEIHTRRNAGSQLVEGLQAIEILDLTTEAFGLTQADLHTMVLDEDPTNGNPYDDLSQVYYGFVAVPGGAKRLVAEVIASEAPDVDLFVLYDTGAGFAEVCASTTPSWNEYCDLPDPAAGDYLVIVQNWAGSSSQPDAITLATAVVPSTDAGNMDVVGPESVPVMEPFDLRIFWNSPQMVAGDRWYGAFSLGSEPGSEGDIGTIPVNIVRHEDDVVKTASTDFAAPGDTVTYRIEIRPNVTSEDLTYTLTDTIPEGLSYVPGSVTGGATVTGDTLTWTGVMPSGFYYQMSTNATDPGCDTGFGGYVNLADYGIYAQAGISGDTTFWTSFTGFDFPYYGASYNGLSFTDDGFGIFDVANNYAGAPWVNQDLPDPDPPNNVLAAFWKDLEIVYDGPSNHGVSLAAAGPIALVEYDDVIPYEGDGSIHYDFEMVVDSDTGNIAFAYDNLVGGVNDVTIGVENATGTKATQYAYNDGTPSTIYDGLVVCFDRSGPTEPHIITYQVTVDEDAVGPWLVNQVVHAVDNEGSLPVETSFPLKVPTPVGGHTVVGDHLRLRLLLIGMAALASLGLVLTNSIMAVKQRRY